MNKSITRCVIAAALLLGFGPAAHAEGVVEQSAAVSGQTSDDCSMPLPPGGPRPVMDDASATVLRTPNGFTASVSMPTPASGTYCYPPANLAFNPAAGPAVPGHPEVFSLWGIYFNNPENCLGEECSVADVLGPNCVNAEAGAVNLAGHVTGNGTLHLSGHVSVGDGPLGPLGCAPFWNVLGSDIHLAVAPHGMLVPELMPAPIQTPPGGGPGYWYASAVDAVE